MSQTRPQAAPVQAEAYDQVPYDSRSYPQTHPLLLQGVAKCFGLDVPAPDQARILELGCASGGNIIPLAVSYPQSQCVGVDYSQGQIDAGRKQVNALGLHNMKLKHMSVMDITREFGEFDYIIAHGLFSWVPREVQDKVIDICKTNLSENGLAYVSYNALPGWNNYRGLRDILLYHTAQFPDLKTKLQQSRALIALLSTHAKNNASIQARIFQQEALRLAGMNDSYLAHDYLEEENDAFYLHEIVARATSRGLQYVSDVCIDYQYVGAPPPELAAIFPDKVGKEQYIDFMSDRRFRRSLFCHAGKSLAPVTADTIRDGSFVSNFTYPAGFEAHALASGVSVAFAMPNGLTFSTAHPLELALQQVFMQAHKAPLGVDQLTRRVEEKLAAVNFPKAEGNTRETHVLDILLRCIQFGGVQPYAAAPPYVNTVSDTPGVTELVRYQVKHQDWVSNQRHEIIQLAPIERMLLQELNGSRDLGALLDQMVRHVESGALNMQDMGRAVPPAEARQKLEPVIKQTLQSYCYHALLVK